jgi:vacuolar-type H+-ATPase subunit H
MGSKKHKGDLKDRVEGLTASVTADVKEGHEQLKQRIDQAEADADRVLTEAKQEASAAASKAQSSWEQTRSDAKARLDEL